MNDIHNLRLETAALIQLFAGQEKDVGDFRMVQKQLERAESHYRQLDSDNLSEDDLNALLTQCAASTVAEFSDDGPPLDNEALYEGIASTIRARRQQAADDWMRIHVPGIDDVLGAAPERALQMKSRLQDPPRVLSAAQLQLARDAFEACERRLDQLEVEGLVARFQALSEANKRAFLQRIRAFVSI